MDKVGEREGAGGYESELYLEGYSGPSSISNWYEGERIKKDFTYSSLRPEANTQERKKYDREININDMNPPNITQNKSFFVSRQLDFPAIHSLLRSFTVKVNSFERLRFS